MSGACGLSPSEWKLMSLLWEEAPRTIAQLTAAVKGDTGWTKNTVISFLNRMERKGAVYYAQGGRARAYFPAVKREEAAAAESERFIKRVYGGRAGLLISSLISRSALEPEEIDELIRLLRAAGKNGGEDRD